MTTDAGQEKQDEVLDAKASDASFVMGKVSNPVTEPMPIISDCKPKISLKFPQFTLNKIILSVILLIVSCFSYAVIVSDPRTILVFLLVGISIWCYQAFVLNKSFFRNPIYYGRVILSRYTK